jgi:mannose-6-phosphate isomerase-like protein (cupin superfamily)
VNEGVTIERQQGVGDVYAVETTPWQRTSTKTAFLDLTTDSVKGSIVDIPPGGKYNVEKHMYEEIFFVLNGRGATTVWVESNSPRQNFGVEVWPHA